ncbi:aldehyde dehydrogenase family protein [Psychromonas algarum]|uniref:aldehyde dehydrogenase family protein n=1 Tax=Psychromonas algarum TaxID=2555643 RepID=UPI001419E179|nr:aldehyde dehydrogenase family protein [Psychromonas sp. RZ22]
MSQLKLESTQYMLEQAKSAWLVWNTMDIVERVELISKWSELLSQQRDVDLMPAQMADFHTKQALSLIGEPLTMPGPTGESNILSASGRGTFVIIAEKNVPSTALVAMISCALVTGNSIVIEQKSEYQEIIDSLLWIFSFSNIEESVVQVIEPKNVDSLISQPAISGVAYVGHEGRAIDLNRTLAKREGQIAQLIIETDLDQLACVRDEHLLLHFITEKTQTINVTAVGGNASLLALGSGDL